jgi:EpsI family protein
MRKSVLYVATLGMLTTALALGTWSQHRPTESLYRPLQDIPATLGQWHLVQVQQLTPSVEDKLRASSYLSRTYSNGQTNLDLFIAYYAVQRAGESMHSPKHCLPGAGWDISHHETLDLPLAGRTVEVNKYDIQKGTEHALTLYWYQSRDRIIANEYSAKVMLAYDSILKGRTAGSIVRIVCPNNTQSTVQAEKFAKLVIPQMQKCLDPR